MRQPFTDGNYNSISDFLKAVQLSPVNAKNHFVWADFMNGKRSAEWYGAGCRNGQDVIKLMQNGWQEGISRLDDMRGKISVADLAPRDRRRRMTRGPTGDVLDIHSVYSGRLDTAWKRATRQASYGPQRVDVVANMIAAGHAHADVLFWRGAAAVVLTDLLEQSGYMVRLVVGFGGNASGRKAPVHTSCRIVVKDHGAPFDIASTSAVILPGFFRALGHAWIAGHADFDRQGNGGIGVGSSNIEAGEITLSHNVLDHGTAQAFVEETISKLNQQAA